MALAKTFAILVAVGALLIWGLSALPPFPTASIEELAEVPEEALVASPMPVAEDGPATLEGVAIHDAKAEPRVPYIQYEFVPGEVRTKQLIFRHERGCSPRAGDLPCALGTYQGSNPEVPYGERIRVTGTIVGDQILVDSIQVL